MRKASGFLLILLSLVMWALLWPFVAVAKLTLLLSQFTRWIFDHGAALVLKRSK